MNDDVVSLLTTRVQGKAASSSKSSSSEQDLTSVSPSVSLFKFKHEPDSAANENARAASIDDQIKNLEEQARHLREKLNLSINSSLNNSFKQPESYKAVVVNRNHLNEPDVDSNSADVNWMAQHNNYRISSTPKAGSLNHFNMAASVNNFSSEIKSEDVYFTQVREKLDSQVKETEALKQQITKPRQLVDSGTMYFSIHENASSQPANSMIAKSQHLMMPPPSAGPSSVAMIDEVVDLRVKLKEAHTLNEELKASFQNNLNQLQMTIRECVDDRDKILAKKENRIRELEEECVSLRTIMNRQQSFIQQNPTFEKLCNKMQNADELCNRLRSMLIEEEKKREKSYFIIENKKTSTDDIEDHAAITQSIYNGFVKCLEDYAGEIKHTKVIQKELQNSWENKERQLATKETSLNDEFNKKCDAIKLEYDKLLSAKTEELNALQEQIDELQSELTKTKECNRHNSDTKDVEIKTLKANLENSKYELTTAQNEMKQMKSRIEVLRTKEKENKLESDGTISQLESENEKLSAQCDEQTKELSQWQNKYDAIKCQLGKYEQLIDNLNEQVILLKRDSRENQMNVEQLSKSYEFEKDIRFKLEAKSKILEEQLNEKIEVLSKHADCEKNMTSLQAKAKQIQSILNAKTNELEKLEKKCEQSETKSQAQSEHIQQLIEQRSVLEVSLKQLQSDLSELKDKYQSSASVIQQTQKSNSTLKEEKEALQKMIGDNLVKLKSIKTAYDQLADKYKQLEAHQADLKIDNELTNKKMQELKKTYETVFNEKETCAKELNESKIEVTNLQTNLKTLNRKLMQAIAEKDSQLSQLQQSVALYEKEIHLIKQAESLQKNQEETKVMEVANSIHMKLTQKKNKIEMLRTKLTACESFIGNLQKELVAVQEDKAQLESQLITATSRYQALQIEFKKVEGNLAKTQEKLSNYEKALEKAAIKYTNLENTNAMLNTELVKLKAQLLNKFMMPASNELVMNGIGNSNNPASRVINSPTKPSFGMNGGENGSSLNDMIGLNKLLFSLLVPNSSMQPIGPSTQQLNSHQMSISNTKQQQDLNNFLNALMAVSAKPDSASETAACKVISTSTPAQSANGKECSDEKKSELVLKSSEAQRQLREDDLLKNHELITEFDATKTAKDKHNKPKHSDEIGIVSKSQQEEINILMESHSSMDTEQSALLNEESNTNFLEANKQLCNRIEQKLSELNKIGLNLKKENTEASQILLRTNKSKAEVTNRDPKGMRIKQTSSSSISSYSSHASSTPIISKTGAQ